MYWDTEQEIRCVYIIELAVLLTPAAVALAVLLVINFGYSHLLIYILPGLVIGLTAVGLIIYRVVYAIGEYRTMHPTKEANAWEMGCKPNATCEDVLKMYDDELNREVIELKNKYLGKGSK